MYGSSASCFRGSRSTMRSRPSITPMPRRSQRVSGGRGIGQSPHARTASDFGHPLKFRPLTRCARLSDHRRRGDRPVDRLGTLAARGFNVVLEQGEFGRESSWAGAGMLPPGNLDGAGTPEALLRSHSHRLWPEWSAGLREIDRHRQRLPGVAGVSSCDSADRLTNSTTKCAAGRRGSTASHCRRLRPASWNRN